jgi:hypothetical protein
MKYWIKYLIAIVIIILVFLMVKVIPFWITLVLIALGAGCHLFYRYTMLKDIIK